MKSRPASRSPLVGMLLTAVLLGLAGCQGQQDAQTESTPPAEVAETRTEAQWQTLLTELRSYERSIGFGDMPNFARFAPETPGFPFCGSTPKTYLPYSYQDPAIVWSKVSDEDTCRAAAAEADVMFSETEAIGERAAPVTPSMLAAPLPRLMYLVIHEDCHDQFQLPFGVEEPLCNLITFKALLELAGIRQNASAEDRAAIEKFARDGETRARETTGIYGRMQKLYEQHGRGEIGLEEMLSAREPLFREAETALQWPPETANNVWMANAITYARHYAALEAAFTAMGGDLRKLVAFFREVDRAKPSAAQLQKSRRLKDQEGVAFLQAYESAVIGTVETLLATGRGN